MSVAKAASPDWQGDLEPDEEILWQGRPDGTFVFDGTTIVRFGLAAAYVVAVIWGAVSFGFNGTVLTVFLLLALVPGLALAAGAILGPSFIRRRTWYALTNKRALIWTMMPLKGQRLKSYPITSRTLLSTKAGPPQTIFFAEELDRDPDGEDMSVPVGFERITEADEVMTLMRGLQKENP